MRPRALVAWSTGKDSAFALHEVRRGGLLEVAGLLTTLTRDYGRVSMHGVREEILDRQADELGLPCLKVGIPAGCVNDEYERAMGEAVVSARADGMTHVVFGDIFLEDVRAYRERMLSGTGLTPVFPLWGRRTDELAQEIVAAGVTARIVCMDPRRLPASCAGRAFDGILLEGLPEDVDPCGENGEFHTCVTGGPMFRRPIEVEVGETVLRDAFVFADLRLAGGPAA